MKSGWVSVAAVVAAVASPQLPRVLSCDPARGRAHGQGPGECMVTGKKVNIIHGIFGGGGGTSSRSSSGGNRAKM